MGISAAEQNRGEGLKSKRKWLFRAIGKSEEGLRKKPAANNRGHSAPIGCRPHHAPWSGWRRTAQAIGATEESRVGVSSRWPHRNPTWTLPRHYSLPAWRIRC